MERKTPLYETHLAEGGKMTSFAGYLLPVQYSTGVVTEHLAVRRQAGLFDVSHMGEILLSGPAALPALNHLMTNDFTSMTDGRVRYTVMCSEQGGCLDDLVVYRFGPESYLAVVNAANRKKDLDHIRACLPEGASAEDISDSVAQLALQGPRAPEILARLLPPEQIPQKYYTAVRDASPGGIPCMISRTGYTGEAGYELYTAAEHGAALWALLREAGRTSGLIPCGLGARDTLRLEAAMPLYGHEMDETISPLEAGLGFAVKLDKPEFIGKDALLDSGAPGRIRVGLEVTGRGIVRERQDLYLGDRKVGVTTSGTYAPFLGRAIAMALVDSGVSAPGTELEAEVRGRRIPVETVPLPFLRPGGTPSRAGRKS